MHYPTDLPLFLNDQQVDTLLTTALALSAVEDALAAHAAGDCLCPPKPYLRPGGRDGEFTCGRYIAMPAQVGGTVQAIGIKWIASVPANVAKGLPRASGLVILNDPSNGRPLCVMECGILSARRTGAVAASAFRLFGVPGMPVAIVGAGPISQEVIRGIASLNVDPVEFRLFDLNTARATDLAERLRAELNIVIRVADSITDALDGCGNVICATTGAKGYITAGMLPTTCKFLMPLSLDDFTPDAVMSASHIVCDDFDQCNREEKTFHKLAQAGKITRNSIYAELGQVISGRVQGRQGQERFFVNAMGLAIEDIAAARAVLTEHQRAQ